MEAVEREWRCLQEDEEAAGGRGDKQPTMPGGGDNHPTWARSLQAPPLPLPAQPLELPALLRVPLGLLRKMVRVRVERAGAVTLHHSNPNPSPNPNPNPSPNPSPNPRPSPNRDPHPISNLTLP